MHISCVTSHLRFNFILNLLYKYKIGFRIIETPKAYQMKVDWSVLIINYIFSST